jgi:hypothetical protein
MLRHVFIKYVEATTQGLPSNPKPLLPKGPISQDIRLIQRRRKEATGLLGFDASQGAYGGRGGAAEDLGRYGQPRVGKTSRVEGC